MPRIETLAHHQGLAGKGNEILSGSGDLAPKLCLTRPRKIKVPANHPGHLAV